MKALYWIFPMLATCAWAAEPAYNEAIRKAIATFNNPRERATVLARDADIPPLEGFAGQEVSQVYLGAPPIKLGPPEVAFVAPPPSQFGTLIRKRGLPAVFVLKREGGAW